MSAKGFWAAQDGHVVNILPPIDITGGKTAQAFSMETYAHASIILLIGVSAAALTDIIVNACTDAAGDNPTAIAFNLFKQETSGANQDVLSGINAIAAAGYVPSANDNIFYVIEIDAAALPQGSPYVQLKLTNGANSVIAAALAMLSGGRNTSDQSPTVCT